MEARSHSGLVAFRLTYADLEAAAGVVVDKTTPVMKVGEVVDSSTPVRNMEDEVVDNTTPVMKVGVVVVLDEVLLEVVVGVVVLVVLLEEDVEVDVLEADVLDVGFEALEEEEE